MEGEFEGCHREGEVGVLGSVDVAPKPILLVKRHILLQEALGVDESLRNVKCAV